MAIFDLQVRCLMSYQCDVAPTKVLDEILFKCRDGNWHILEVLCEFLCTATIISYNFRASAIGIKKLEVINGVLNDL